MTIPQPRKRGKIYCQENKHCFVLRDICTTYFSLLFLVGAQKFRLSLCCEVLCNRVDTIDLLARHLLTKRKRVVLENGVFMCNASNHLTTMHRVNK